MSKAFKSTMLDALELACFSVFAGSVAVVLAWVFGGVR